MDDSFTTEADSGTSQKAKAFFERLLASSIGAGQIPRIEFASRRGGAGAIVKDDTPPRTRRTEKPQLALLHGKPAGMRIVRSDDDLPPAG